MRKAIIIALLLVTGCSAMKPLPGSRVLYGYDFTDYTQQGFLFTPEGYNQDYNSIGLLNLTFTPQVVEPQGIPANKSMNDFYRVNAVDGSVWYVEKLDMQTAIDSMYSKASNMGADALIRFDASYNTRPHYEISITEIEVSGFAIKRQQ